MITLSATNQSLELVTSSASAIDVIVSFVDITSNALAGLDSQESAISTATTTTVLAAPGASTKRQIKLISIYNKGAVSNTVTVQKDIAATNYLSFIATLLPGEKLVYCDGLGFQKFSSSGEYLMREVDSVGNPITALSFNCLKVGATTEAAGVLHFLGLSSGFPGAWAPGTPGLNGRATDGTNSGDAGAIPVKNPTSLSNYLTSFQSNMTVAGMPMLMDLLWVNSGLVVTTTTAQAITPVALPSRDANGSTNGSDVMAGILVTTATTNAGAVTNMTISYTNQDGTSGRTATMASFPATAVAGSIVPFQLQSGDSGVRSVQSVTLGTSLVTGAVSLILFRVIAMAPVLVANAGGKMENSSKVNLRLYNGVCLLPAYFPTATTATNLFMTMIVEEK